MIGRGEIFHAIVCPFMAAIGMSIQMKESMPFGVTKMVFMWKYILSNKLNNGFNKSRSKKMLYLVRLNKLHEQGLGNTIFFFSPYGACP
jgi:hypothetical protein